MNGHDPRPEAFDDAFAPAPLEAVDQRLYREAMSRYGAAVHVITTDGSSGKAGFTATAVCSVTDDPPTLLVCLHRKGQVVPILAANCVFCVNTLAYTDEGVSNVFAGRTGAKLAERFETGLWESLKTGAPVLSSAIVARDCRVTEVKVVGTHNVIFGVVQAVAIKTTEPALVYQGRSYKSL